MDKLRKEFDFFLEGIRKTKFQKITKEKVFFELITNGVAAIIAYLVYALFHNLIFNIEKGHKIWWKRHVSHKDSLLDITQKEFDVIYDWIGIPIIFVIGLVVFTAVEQLMENYLNARKEKH